MAVKLGSTDINKIYLGSTEIKKAYLGSTLIYDKTVGGWTPADLASLVAWYDASDTATITQSSGAVSQWDDKDNSGNDQTQATGNKQPTTGTDTQNSLNVLTWPTGNDDVLENTSFANLPAGDFTLFAVYKRDASASNPSGNISVIAHGGTSSNLSDRAFHLSYNDTSFRVLVADNSGNKTLDQTRNDLYNIHSVIADFGSTLKYRLNAANEQSTALGTAVKAVTQLAIGDFLGNGVTDYNLRGKLAEIIICSSALSAGDVSSAESYLANKWGITI